MHFARDDNAGGLLVRSYSAGEIKIGDSGYTKSLILTPSQIITEWTPQNLSDLRPEHFETVLVLNPELVLLGTGEKLRFPPPVTTAGLLMQGIGVEVMDTAAACRTYNVLVSEDRNVVAALLL